jgi:hypothetical protein
MVYNRCIGTRYCANNCPYKVRRFNFFNYNKDPATTRDSCAWCSTPTSRPLPRRDGEVHLLRAAHPGGQDRRPRPPATADVADGGHDRHRGCAQAARPGDRLRRPQRPESRVSKPRRQIRNYGVLSDLNTKPRTTYLARVRNPNPELVAMAST